jgi:hypothetical protein
MAASLESGGVNLSRGDEPARSARVIHLRDGQIVGEESRRAFK